VQSWVCLAKGNHGLGRGIPVTSRRITANRRGEVCHRGGSHQRGDEELGMGNSQEGVLHTGSSESCVARREREQRPKHGLDWHVDGEMAAPG